MRSSTTTPPRGRLDADGLEAEPAVRGARPVATTTTSPRTSRRPPGVDRPVRRPRGGPSRPVRRARSRCRPARSAAVSTPPTCGVLAVRAAVGARTTVTRDPIRARNCASSTRPGRRPRPPPLRAPPQRGRLTVRPVSGLGQPSIGGITGSDAGGDDHRVRLDHPAAGDVDPAPPVQPPGVLDDLDAALAVALLAVGVVQVRHHVVAVGEERGGIHPRRRDARGLLRLVHSLGRAAAASWSACRPSWSTRRRSARARSGRPTGRRSGAT